MMSRFGVGAAIMSDIAGYPKRLKTRSLTAYFRERPSGSSIRTDSELLFRGVSFSNGPLCVNENVNTTCCQGSQAQGSWIH
jgi:hypothetical protein